MLELDAKQEFLLLGIFAPGAAAAQPSSPCFVPFPPAKLLPSKPTGQPCLPSPQARTLPPCPLLPPPRLQDGHRGCPRASHVAQGGNSLQCRTLF